MCGIAGFFSTDCISEGESRLRDAVAALRHRGPDGSGIWHDAGAGIGLAHVRLKIVELTDAGAQPMHSADGRFVITYNGEIYNHLALRRELIAGGAAPGFRGGSDTETLLAACAAWGVEAAVRRCAGMFAFALWDRHERRLYLVRDRLGIKPLYWGHTAGSLIFGSELKGLLPLQTASPVLHQDAIQDFLHYGFIPAPLSIYQGIKKLPPGAMLICSHDAEPVETHYWSMADVVNAPRHCQLPEAVDAMDDLLQSVVRDHLMADVPVGVFLSGGIDSALVTALMQRAGSKPLRTFSIGFAECSHDEAMHAARVARHLDAAHTELRVSPAEALAVIPSLAAMYDEPFADSSQIPTALLARLTRSQVTVALSGDGGDEMCAGYNRHVYANCLLKPAMGMPRQLKQGVAWGLDAATPARWDAAAAWLPRRLRPPQAADKLHKLAAILRAPPDSLYAALLATWPDASSTLPGAGTCRVIFGDAAVSARLNGLGEHLQYLDTTTYLPDDVLVKVDRATMAVGLECRVPLLDHRVIEAAWTLPWSLRARGVTGKWLLRKVLERYLPRTLFDRPKTGFAVPLADWLRGGLRDWAEAMLEPKRLETAGVLEPSMVRALWQQHLSGRHNRHQALWNILTFQAWYEHWRT